MGNKLIFGSLVLVNGKMGIKSKFITYLCLYKTDGR